MAAIECIKFNEYWLQRAHRKGHLVGFATLRVPKMGIEIEGVTLWEKDDRRWVNLPSNDYVDKDTGEKKYKKIIRFINPEHGKLFAEEAKIAIDDFVSQQPLQPSANNQQEFLF